MAVIGAARTTRRATTAIIAAIGLLSTATLVPTPAAAVGRPYAQPTVVADTPAATTPSVTNGTVYAITSVGNQVILGGSFTTAQSAGSSDTLTRTDVLAFDPTTGVVSSSFNPVLDGTVNAVEPGPTPDTVYVGGYFKTVGGVKSKGITLLDTRTGAIVSGFKPPILNGAVVTIARTPQHVLIGGSFTLAGAASRGGLASLDPGTGALDNFLSVQLLGHHNYDGNSGANGFVGPRAMAVDPAAHQLMVIGNFTTADGIARDQIARVDLTGATAVVDPNWSTLQYTARCAWTRNDSYLTDVQFSPDGSYFAITATGTTGTNVDGTKALCDSVSRWPAAATGANLTPTWVDWTGQDTLWSVAVTGSAIYVGGHQRWLNNPTGPNTAAAGAVPRPGLGAVDPVSGVPLRWNPGRNPRGAGAYALYVNADGLYVGSDTDYVGDYAYKRPKISFFPLAGGTQPASTATAALPANVYLAGPTSTSATTPDDLAYRAMSDTDIGATTVVGNTGIAWGSTRGAFVVGDTVFYGVPGATPAANTFYQASFTAAGVGTPTRVDPYNDPAWTNVQTGSGQTYRGVSSGYYAEISSLTSAFYAGGRLYYTLAGRSALYWRWFSPDSGTVGGDEATITGADFSNVAGLTASGDALYYADAATGQLHRMSFAGQTPDPTTDTVLSGPTLDGLDWRARSLLLHGRPTFPTYSGPNTPATPSAAISCAQLTCQADATASHDPDPEGAIVYYGWDFGDGTTATGPSATHGYATPGTYTVTLRVIDNRRASSTQTQQVSVDAPLTPISAVGATNRNMLSTAPNVAVPVGTQPGDTELLVVSTGSAGVTTGLPSGDGWQLLTRRANVLETSVYARTAAVGDPATVTVPLSTSSRADLTLSTYRGVAATSAVTGSDVSSATHVAPATTVTTGGSWVVSYWAARSSTPTNWTPAPGLAVRSTGVGTGGGHIDSVTADNARGLASGGYPGQTTTSNVVTSRAITASVVLAPGA